MTGAPWFIILLLMLATSLIGYVVGFIHGGVLEMQKRNGNDNSSSNNIPHYREERPTVVEINLNESCRHRTVHSELDNGYHQPRLRRIPNNNFSD